MMEAVVVIVAAAAWLGMRHVAARRIVRGHGEFIWLWLVPQLLIVAVLASLATRFADHEPLLATFFAIVTIAFGAFVLRFGTSLQRAIAAPSGAADQFERPFEVLTDHILGLAVIGLGVAIVGGLILIGSALLGAPR